MSELPTNVGTSDGRNFRRSELPTFVGTSDVRRDFRRAQLNKQSAALMPGLPTWVKSVSELPTNVGTSDGRDFRWSSGLSTSTVTAQAVTGSQHFWQESWLPTVGSSGLCRDFRHRQSQKIILCAREVLECFFFDLIIMLEHSIFLRPPKLASLLIVRHTY